MTSHDEQRLSDALRRQADSSDPHLLTLDEVTGRARGIRRRRIATGVVAAAAVAAIVVPTAIVTAGGTDDRSNPPQFATQTPTGDASGGPTPSTVVDATDKHLNVDVLADLPTGAAPSIAVRIGSEVLLPDGTRVKVGDDAVYTAFVSGRVLTVERTGDEQGTFFVRGADGKVELEEPANIDGALSVSPDHTAAAYVGTDGRIHTWTEQDGDLTFSEPLQNVQLGPMTGSGSCMEESEGGGCSVLVNRGEGGTQVYASHGPGDAVPGFIKVSSASGQVLAGQTKSFNEGSCSEVRELGGSRSVETCKYTLGSFSPDGRLIVGGPGYLDGPCCVRYDILDTSNLKSLITLNASAGREITYINEVGWEDDSHALATVFDGKAWKIVRIGVDGSAEIADAGPMPSGDVGEVPVRLDVGR